MLRLGDNTQLAGDDLMAMIEKARNAKHLLEPLGRKVGNRDVVEQTAIAGALNREVLSDSEKATGAAQYVARRLDTRSEEHTSELPSLMRITYAVFCLKKQTINTSKTLTRTTHYK